MNVNFNEIINKFKTDKVFKTKVLKSTGLAIGAIVFLIFISQKDINKNNDTTVLEQSSMPVDDYFLADTTNIIDDKNAIYKFDEEEKKDGSEIELQKVESEKNNENADIDAYIKKRETQMSKINNYQKPAPERREYNPNPPTRTIESRNTYVQENPNTVNNVGKTTQTIQQPKERTLEDIIREKNQKKNSGTISAIKAVIHNDQTITANSTTVRLRLIEPINVDGYRIETNQFIYAKASMGNNNINLFIENFSSNGMIIPANLWAYEVKTGMKGITVNSDNLVGSAEKMAENKGSQVVTKYGGEIGNAIKDVLSGRNKQQKINLTAETQLILKK